MGRFAISGPRCAFSRACFVLGRWIVSALLTLLPAACREQADPTPVQSNVILISLDTLRADHLSCYGYGRETSPHIDQLSREGVLFARAVAQSPWTLQSHASMFTALYPSRHLCGVGSNVANPDLVTLAEVLRDNGYKTAAFTGGGKVSREFNLNQGFEEWFEYTPSYGPNDVVFAAQAGLRWLEGHFTEKFFLFLHTYEVHVPYNAPGKYKKLHDPDPNYAGLVKRGYPPEEFGLRFTKGKTIPFDKRLVATIPPSEKDVQHLIARYDGEVTFTDAYLIKNLVDFLKRKDLYDKTLIVLTSDHGEALGERNNFLHFEGLYREYTYIPLIIKPPASFKCARNRRIDDAVVGLIDIFPTVLDMLGISHEDAIDGRSLVPVMTGLPAGDGVLFAESSNYIAVEESGGRYKVLYNQATGQWQMFDNQADFGDTRDLLSSSQDEGGQVLARLSRHVREFMEKHPSSWNDHQYRPMGQGDIKQTGPDGTPMSDEMRERLKSLGYVP